jgi:tRNA A37 threonylcarbamoyladenosine dehydratase
MTGNPLSERTRILVGADGVAALRRARVFLAGLGGVGSYAAEALARAGIGAIALVDHDRVAPSNLNRQLPALNSTLGRKKIEVMAERILDINPSCQLTLVDDFLSADNVAAHLAGGYDSVLDAIDSLSSKTALIETAYRTGLAVVSSMGAGGRLDPTRIRVSDLQTTRVCPLARAVRTQLRRRGIGRGVTAVWSDETPLPPLPPEDVGRGRPRAVNGTVSYVPALFGLTLAGVAIRGLLGIGATSAGARPAN